MTDYITLRIDLQPCSEDITDLAASHLAEIGFDSFVPDETGLEAYIPVKDFSLDKARQALAAMEIPVECSFTATTVEGRDWNEEWEKNYFKPIVVGRRCVVHSSFHTDVPDAEFDIVVDPKMAFGTGHHSTTRLMLEYLLELPLEGRSLIDMGTGTGILSILAAMRGASPVTGIEIDPDACRNAQENVRLNSVDAEMICGDAAALEDLEDADFFLANINRNIILADLPRYGTRLKKDATVLFSGFYRSDLPMVEAEARKQGLVLLDFKEDKDWVAARFEKK